MTVVDSVGFEYLLKYDSDPVVELDSSVVLINLLVVVSLYAWSRI